MSKNTMTKKTENIVDLIRDLRKQNNITQDELRLKVGMNSHASYNYKETKKGQFTLDEFLRVAEALDIQIKLSYKLNENDGREVIKEITL